MLKILHEQGRSIIDWDAMPAVFAMDTGEADDGPSYAIEDFTSDYEDDVPDDEDDVLSDDF